MGMQVASWRWWAQKLTTACSLLLVWCRCRAARSMWSSGTRPSRWRTCRSSGHFLHLWKLQLEECRAVGLHRKRSKGTRIAEWKNHKWLPEEFPSHISVFSSSSSAAGILQRFVKATTQPQLLRFGASPEVTAWEQHE